MSANVLDPTKATLTVGTLLVEGYMEGTMISPAWLADSNVLAMGGQGKGTMIVTNDLSAEITINLQQSAASNTRLTLIFNLNRTGILVPVTIRDASGDTLLIAATAWVKKLPDAPMSSNGVEARTWVLATDRLSGIVGGNPVGATGSA